MAHYRNRNERTQAFCEENILKKVIEYMVNDEQFEVLIKSDFLNEKHKPVILGRKGNILRQVVVVGLPFMLPSIRLSDNRKEKLNDDQLTNLAQVNLSKVIFELISQKSQNEDLEIGLGLPKFQAYLDLLNKIKFLREEMEIYCYLVDENGQVRLILPQENVSENSVKETSISSLVNKIKRIFMFTKRCESSNHIFYQRNKQKFPTIYDAFEQLIKNRRPLYILDNALIYDLTKDKSVNLKAYVYFDALKKSYKLLPKESVRKCMNTLIDYIFNQFRRTASITECLEICNATEEAFITCIVLLYKKGVISLKNQRGKTYIRLRLGYNYLRALGFDIKKGRKPIVYRCSQSSGILFLNSEHKQIFNKIVEEEKRRMRLFREG
ncbi:hypothetical protein DRO22_02765 [Candidatus Bathyarchaeota archaeon]|nr:MAG: hypothetical protein DRO22_02765 [Candidatus Bathyarchaeota archaeon]